MERFGGTMDFLIPPKIGNNGQVDTEKGPRYWLNLSLES
jgi:hypothetical protein